jgi:two-component system sensor histidine kinase KdpD
VLLTQLLGNLLDNALKYSSGAMDLVHVSTPAPRAAPCNSRVKDRGEAIALERQQAIFEPYARNDQSGQRGAGLGLALCRAIAQAHGGSLTVRRRNGGGNSFTFSMPVNPQQPVGDAACPCGAGGGRRPRNPRHDAVVAVGGGL